ncbi:hypothetical protein C8J56DRAFT_1060868 [Mycena floridula]|nr:hypothetical protein C8J56DRAFT_1060868 [Mycena floridula]
MPPRHASASPAPSTTRSQTRSGSCSISMTPAPQTTATDTTSPAPVVQTGPAPIAQTAPAPDPELTTPAPEHEIVVDEEGNSTTSKGKRPIRGKPNYPSTKANFNITLPGAEEEPSIDLLKDLGNDIEEFFEDNLPAIDEEGDDETMPGHMFLFIFHETPIHPGIEASPALARAITTSLNPFTTDERLRIDIQRALDNSSAPAAEAEEADPANRKFAAGKDVLSTLRYKRQRVAQTGAGKTTSPAPVSDSDDEVQEILRAATPVAAPAIIVQAPAPARATFAAIAAIPYAPPVAQAPVGPIAPVAVAIPVVADQAFTPFRYMHAATRTIPLTRITQPPAPNWPQPELDPHVLTMNQDLAQFAAWSASAGERLYAYIAGGNQVAPALVAGFFRDLVAGEAPGSAATLQIGPPNAVNPPRGIMASPAAWIIRGTDIGDTDHLSDLAVLAQEG